MNLRVKGSNEYINVLYLMVNEDLKDVSAVVKEDKDYIYLHRICIEHVYDSFSSAEHPEIVISDKVDDLGNLYLIKKGLRKDLEKMMDDTKYFSKDQQNAYNILSSKTSKEIAFPLKSEIA